MQDGLKMNEKSLNQFQNVLMRIKRLQLKQEQRKKICETKKIQNILKDIFKNKIKNIKKRRSTKNCTCNCTKKKKII